MSYAAPVHVPLAWQPGESDEPLRNDLPYPLVFIDTRHDRLAAQVLRQPELQLASLTTVQMDSRMGHLFDLPPGNVCVTGWRMPVRGGTDQPQTGQPQVRLSLDPVRDERLIAAIAAADGLILLDPSATASGQSPGTREFTDSRADQFAGQLRSQFPGVVLKALEVHGDRFMDAVTDAYKIGRLLGRQYGSPLAEDVLAASLELAVGQPHEAEAPVVRPGRALTRWWAVNAHALATSTPWLPDALAGLDAVSMSTEAHPASQDGGAASSVVDEHLSPYVRFDGVENYRTGERFVRLSIAQTDAVKPPRTIPSRIPDGEDGLVRVAFAIDQDWGPLCAVLRSDLASVSLGPAGAAGVSEAGDLYEAQPGVMCPYDPDVVLDLVTSALSDDEAWND